MRFEKMRGFSLNEMLIAIVIGLVATAIAIVSLGPSLQAAHVANAYNTTLAAIRQARDYAVAQRQEYSVTFSNAAIPNTVTIKQVGNGNTVATYQLPSDVAFTTVTGIPTSPAGVPDGFGAGATAIDFDQGFSNGAQSLETVIIFWPNGTGQDASGNINNGVVYIAMPNELFTSRAITVWGATGRIRGWRLYGQSANSYWRQM
jgi:prepilin-type N-terminal cleavage/methylation domain-containing protein